MKKPIHPDKLRDEMLKAREKADTLRREVLDKMSALATAAFGLVAALAWNNAIQALFKRYYPAPDDPNALWPLIGYASIVTIIGVLIIVWIGRLTARLKEPDPLRATAQE